MPTRITGLYSGLDVDALVEAGASYYQNKVNTAKQSEQKLEWQQEQYRAIQSSVQTFYDKYLTTTGEDSLMMSSNWNTNSYTSSNSSAVSATSTSNSTLDDYTVSVSKLASAATATIKSSKIASDGKITISYSDGSSTYNSSSIDLSSCTTDAQRAAAINTAISSDSNLKGKFTAAASDLNGGVTLTTANNGGKYSLDVTSNNSTIASGTGTYLNAIITNSSGTTYTIDDNTNKTAANTTTLDGVTFNFNSTTTSSASSSSYLSSSNITSFLGDNIKAIDTSDSSKTVYTMTDGNEITITNKGLVTAKDSSGTNITSASYTSNDGTTNAITFASSDSSATIKTTTNSPITITGTKDVSDVQDKIQSFMDDYNTLMKTINGKIYETYTKSYQPLTDSEKSSMTDSQITKWETKAQTGLLRHDSYLEKLANDMKSAMSSLFKNSGIDIESIGIKAVKDYTTKNGTYTVDSNKLKSALEGGITKTSGGETKTISFDDIKNLFTNGYSSITTLSSKNSDGDGILSRLKVALNTNATMSSSELAKRAGIQGTTSETTNEITQLLKDKNTLIHDLEEKLSDKENALYSKYSKLETSLSSLESSSSIFSSSS